MYNVYRKVDLMYIYILVNMPSRTEFPTKGVLTSEA